MKVYGIKNCDTVKKALKYLDEKSISYEFIDFKKTPPTKSLLKKWTKELGDIPVNKRGTTFRKFKGEFEESNKEEKINLLVENSSAIKRPIVEASQTIMGFDKEKWDELL